MCHRKKLGGIFHLKEHKFTKKHANRKLKSKGNIHINLGCMQQEALQTGVFVNGC